MIKLRKSEGFSLIELMIVVAIIAVLAAIAIPSFLRFQLRSKTSEATTNLGGIRTCEETYRAEEDLYLACAAHPAAIPTGTPVTWAGAPVTWASIGFEPDGNVRYQYSVAIPAAAPFTDFTAMAEGDLDADGSTSTYTVATTAGTYPKAVKGGAGDY